MKQKPERVRVRELEVEKLILREQRGGRVRAVIETVVPRRGQAARVVVTLLAPDGEPMLVAQVDHRGQPRLSVGNPERGPTAIVARDAVDVWSCGNVAASLRATPEGHGTVELLKPEKPRRLRRARDRSPR